MANSINIVTIVQMRMGSSRLPGKSMRTILGKPLVGFLMERLHRINGSHKVVLATTSYSEMTYWPTIALPMVGIAFMALTN